MEVLIETQHMLDFFNEILKKQKSRKILFDEYNFYSPNKLLAFDDFQLTLLNIFPNKPDKASEPLIYTLKRIAEKAKSSLDTYFKLIDDADKCNYTREVAFYSIDLEWNINSLSKEDFDKIADKELSDAPQSFDRNDICDYCLSINTFINNILINTTSNEVLRFKATNAQIAVFLHCMSTGKEIPHPTKSTFKETIARYKFIGKDSNTVSWYDVYNHFNRIGNGTKKDPLTKINLGYCIDVLLKPYPSALRVAEDQLSCLDMK